MLNFGWGSWELGRGGGRGRVEMEGGRKLGAGSWKGEVGMLTV